MLAIPRQMTVKELKHKPNYALHEVHKHESVSHMNLRTTNEPEIYFVHILRIQRCYQNKLTK